MSLLRLTYSGTSGGCAVPSRGKTELPGLGFRLGFGSIKMPSSGMPLSPGRAGRVSSPALGIGRRGRAVRLSVSAARTEQKEAVKLQIRIEHQVQFGEAVGMLGSAKWLGKWQQPVEMRWTESGWTVEIDARPGEEAEFKFVVMGDGKQVVRWEDGLNRKFTVPADVASATATATWSSTDEPLCIEARATRETNGAATNGVPADSDTREERSSDVGTSAFAQSWQGKDVNFMRSNAHSSERRGKWETEGLTGAALAIVEGDRKAGNWWRKLEVVQNLLTPLSAESRLEPLVYSSIYLQWINTGQVACVEDGGHHRPNRHAEISREIFRSLEKDSVHQASPEAVVVMRKVHPRLPSFTAEFTASVPLTRIRDIAHRNDIPHDLKQEIKHTIQNKLHRNAGPEDLVATELLLKRVTATEGQYSAAFLEQLQLFYRELKDFFNASSLAELLESIRPSLDEMATPMLDSFLAAKRKVDSLSGEGAAGSGAMEATATALHALTGLRASLLYHLNSGLRNDASDDAIAMRQKWRLSEIGLEDYSFVLLSRFVNEVEGQGGSATMSAEAEQGTPRLFDASVGAAVLALRQVGLSGWQQAECLCLEHELAAWQAAGMGSRTGGGVVAEGDKRWWALRFKASLDRAKRLTESYTETLLSLYSHPSQVLGSALGIQENAVKTFAEAEIRASVVFQLSKLLTLLLKALRSVLHSQGWDVLMPGVCTGRLHEVERIDRKSLEGVSDDVILLVHRADGDEEVRAAGRQVKGVILLQELPHLSHLAVRARQERVTFVTCDDADVIGSLKDAARERQRVRLEASAEGVKLIIPAPSSSSPSSSDSSASSSTEEPPAVVLHPQAVASGSAAQAPGWLIPLAHADVSTCGAKATSCAQLLRLSQESPSAAAFSAPRGAVIPFGALDDAVRHAGKLAEFQRLVEATETAPLETLDQACSALGSLIRGLSLPVELVALLRETFDEDTRLIARSSANVEDLAGMSGAGLYESIPNVRLADLPAFTDAVTEVWASLYSRRAVLSRRAAGVRQADAAMAVLVQELMAPDLSFVLHTKSLLDGTSHQVHAEIAPGLGETLASGTRGTAYRVAVDKASEEVELGALANFSEQLLVLQGGPGDGRMSRKTVDYSKERLSVAQQELHAVARKLCAVGRVVEEHMGSAQDIEGCFVGDRLVVVQSRPQP